MPVTYTIARRDQRTLTATGGGVTFSVAVGPRGPNLITDSTALGTLTGVTDPAFLLVGAAAGNAARKLVPTAWGLSNLLASVPAGRVPYADATGVVTSNAGLTFDAAAGDAVRAGRFQASSGNSAFIPGAIAFLDFDGSDVRFRNTAAGFAITHWFPGAGGLVSTSAGQFGWTSTGNAFTGSNDTGLARDSLNTVRVTNGSTGVGNLIAGNLTVRQPGGTAGTHELRVSHSGAGGTVTSLSGTLTLSAPSSGGLQVAAGGTYNFTDNVANPRIVLVPTSDTAKLAANTVVGWTNNVTSASGSMSVSLARLDDNTVEINNGTRTASGGALRGLSVSTLTASGAVNSTRPLTANGDSSYLASGSITPGSGVQTHGFRATPAINSGTSAGGTYLSFEANPTYSGTANSPTQVVGFQANLNCVTSTGTISIMEGFRSQGAVIGAAAVVANWRGVRVLTPFTSSGGAVSIVTGLLIDDLTVGSSQNRAIQTGLGEVVFGDTVRLSRLLSLGTYTAATLPSASANAGAFAQVTDSNSTTNGSTVAGGGSNRVPVFSNGTNWIIK